MEHHLAATRALRVEYLGDSQFSAVSHATVIKDARWEERAARMISGGPFSLLIADSKRLRLPFRAFRRLGCRIGPDLRGLV